MLHYGTAGEVIRQRQQVLNGAYARNPERFVKACPKPLPQPTAVWINPPVPAQAIEEIVSARDSVSRSCDLVGVGLVLKEGTA